MSESRTQRWLWGVLGVALVLRLTLLAANLRPGGFAHYFTPDSQGYYLLARQLGEHGQFSQFPGAPAEIFRTPGYPLFLAGVLAVYGENFHALVMVQILLDVLLCWLVYRLGTMLISPPVGLVAAAVQAVTPSSVAYSARVLSDGLFALLLTAGLALLVRHLRAARGWHGLLASRVASGTNTACKQAVPPVIFKDLALLALSGLALGAACLVRPAGLPVIGVAALLLLLRPKRPNGTSLSGRLLSIGVFCVAAAACVAPWVARNHARAGYPRLSSVLDYNLFFYNARALIDARPDIALNDRQRLLALLASEPDWPDQALLNDPVFVRQAGDEGRALILAHPLSYLGVHLRATAGVLLPDAPDVLEVAGLTRGERGTLAVLREQGLLAAVRYYFDGQYGALALAVPLVAIWLIKLLAAIGGAAARLRGAGAGVWLVLLVILYFVLSPGPPANARFRVPIEPLLSVLAAVTLEWVLRKIALWWKVVRSEE